MFYTPLTLTVIATAAIKANRFVSFGGAYPGEDDPALGVARSDGDIGDAVPVDVLGLTTVEAAATCARGDALLIDAEGRAVTTGDGVPCARAWAPATEAGQVIEIVLMPTAAAPEPVGP